MRQRFNIRTYFWMLGLIGCVGSVAPPVLGEGDAGGEKVYRQTLRSTVWVISPRSGGLAASGTGSLIDAKKKLVITNYHVVGENDRVIVLIVPVRNPIRGRMQNF